MELREVFRIIEVGFMDSACDVRACGIQRNRYHLTCSIPTDFACIEQCGVGSGWWRQIRPRDLEDAGACCQYACRTCKMLPSRFSSVRQCCTRPQSPTRLNTHGSNRTQTHMRAHGRGTERERQRERHAQNPARGLLPPRILLLPLLLSLLLLLLSLWSDTSTSSTSSSMISQVQSDLSYTMHCSKWQCALRSPSQAFLKRH